MFRLIHKHYIIIVIAALLAYSIIAIYNTSFIIHGIRYFTASDDEMIGMRYAYNFIHGYGLVWNPAGEHVEGISNPLWVFYMALIHLLPISAAKISLVVQISATLCLAISLFFVKKISELLSNSSLFVGITSVLFAAFYFPLINWSVIHGTEVGLLTLLLTWCTFLALHAVKTKTFSLKLFILLGIGTLVRMDFIVFAAVISGYLLIFDLKNRKRYLTVGIPIVLLFVATQTILRLWYYHDFLPNTYYDKVSGYPILRRITRGFYVAIKAHLPTVMSANLLLFCAPFIYTYFTKNKQLLLLLALFTAQNIYSIYTGGDVWEYYGGANRFVAPAMPLFMICLVMILFHIKNNLKSYSINHRISFKIIGLATICLIWLILNRGNEHELQYLFLMQKPITATDNPSRVEGAYCLNSVTKPGAKIALASNGIVAYLTPGRFFIDELGKTEKTIAHEPTKDKPQFWSTLDKYTSFMPGHMKWDYPYIVQKYRPDVFMEIYQRQGYDHNDQYVLQHGYTKMKNSEGCIYYFLKESPNVIWKNLKKI